MSTSRLLRALADLAPSTKPATYDHLGAKTAWGTGFDAVEGGGELEAYDELHRDERLLRQGWGIVMGRIDIDGKKVLVRMPLVSRAVRLQTAKMRPYDQRVHPAGDIEVHPELIGTDFADRLEAVFDPERRAEATEDAAWLAEAAALAGFEDAEPADRKPRRGQSGLAVVRRPVVYIDRAAAPSPIAAGLRAWSERPGLGATALAAAYGESEDEPRPADRARPRCALPLSREQTEAVLQAREQAVTVIAGAPGCGKSHTLAAIALDAVASGRSVLLATQSVHAADVLAELLDRHPGPVPVNFGDTERRSTLLARLGGDAGKGRDAREVRARRQTADDAAAFAARIETEITDWLELERKRLRAHEIPTFLLGDFPGLAAADLDRAERLLAASQRDGGWWTRFRARRSAERLHALAGAEGTPGELRRAIAAARDQRGIARLAAGGGLRLAPLWDGLDRADADAAEALGTAVRYEVESAERRGAAARRAMGTMVSVLSSYSRTVRRERIAETPTGPLLEAMPLWVGTVGDVEDLLPARAGMFDLVILDEASHINQLRAAPVLARARSAVVSGDPRQLRFVSFAATERLHSVLTRHELGHQADRLDIRRVSAYDLACGAGPIVELTEHHRSVPHIIGFSAAKFYQGRVKPVTTHPRNHETDAVTVHRVEAAKSRGGLVRAEVDAAVDLLAELVEDGQRGLAVLSPFRAQAEAIEQAIVRRFELQTIRERRIRAGTVHAFQGSEADTVIASLGVAPADPAGRLRFAAGANLFNVMITRAREHLHIVTALTDDDGLIGEYLTYADRPPTSPETGDAGDEWTEKLAEALAGGGVRVRRAYPVGHWSVDLVVGDGDAALGVIAAVHPEGPEAHLARHRALRRAGWRLADAFPSTFDDDPARAAVAVLAETRQR